MKKEFNQIEDFLEDPSFREWVLSEGRHRNLYWETWCRNHPKKSSTLHEAKQVLLAMENRDEEWKAEDQDRVFAKINQLIDNDPGEKEGERLQEAPVLYKQVPLLEYRSYERSKHYGFLKVVAIILIMAFGAVVSWQLEWISLDSEAKEETLAWVIKSAKVGEKKRFRLPDGTVATVNASTEIRYNENFGKTNRELWLEGESFFEVAKDSLLPFRVHSDKLITEALGTAFNVSAFSTDEEVKVQLIEGRVSVEKQNETTAGNDLIFLTPGEEASFSPIDFKKANFDIDKALLWTKGILHFDDVPFDHAVKMLERWYGVEITVTGNPGKLPRVSGEFNRDNLENVLNSLSYSFRFAYEIKDDQVRVRFKNSPTK